MWKNFNKTDRRILATALLLLMMMLYFLYDDSLLLPSDDSKNLISIGQISEINQDVRRKVSKQFSWKSARDDDFVHIGDSLFTGKDSTAIVQLTDGRKLTVQPNSLIVFNTAGDQLNLDLRFGRIAGKIDGCLKIVVKGVLKDVCGKESDIEVDSEGDVKPIMIPKEIISWVKLPARPFFHSNHNTDLKVTWKTNQYFSRFHFQISKQKDFKKILFDESVKSQSIETRRYPLEGEFFVRIQGDDITGRPSGFSKTEFIEIKKVPLLTITHPSPQQVFEFRRDADGELLDRNQFNLKWKYPLKNVQFEMEIARDEDFKNIVSKSSKLRKLETLVSNLPTGSYYARVRDMSVTNNVHRPWSVTVPFEIKILEPIRLPTPRLLTRKINHLAPSKDPVIVKWSEVPEADRYVLETASNPQFTDKKTYQTESTAFTLPEIEVGQAYFRVFAATTKGTLGDPSPAGSLKVKLQQPVLSTSEPIDIMGKTPEDPGDPQEVKVSWTDLVLAKKYLVQVSEDKDFENTTEFQTVQPTGNIVLPKPGAFHWRVQPLGKDDKPLADFSAPGKLDYVLRVPLATPGQQEPMDQTTLFFQKNLTSFIWFEWLPVRQAEQYLLEVARDPEFQNKVISTTLKTTRYLMKDHLPDGPLYWRVQAQASGQRISHWSPAREMTVMSGRAPAGKTPADGRK